MSFNTRLALIALVIVLVLVCGFWLFTPRAPKVPTPAPARAAIAASTTPAVSLTDSYKKGVHTLSGSVMAPDACAQVTATAAFATSTGSQEIDLELSLPATQGVCLEVPTEAAFKTTVAAPSGLPVVVELNGVIATTTP